MPYCQVHHSKVGGDSQDVQIYYQTYGRGDTKVLLIMGLAATHEAWNSQILGLVGSDTPNEEDASMKKLSMPLADCQSLHDFASLEDSQDKEDIRRASPNDIHVCAFDNRGVGRSSTPEKKSEYTGIIQDKNHGVGCIRFDGSLGMEKGTCFWSFSRGHDSVQACSNVS